jgi:hypothetical protein
MVMSLLEALRLTFRGVNCIVRWRSGPLDDRAFGGTILCLLVALLHGSAPYPSWRLQGYQFSQLLERIRGGQAEKITQSVANCPGLFDFFLLLAIFTPTATRFPLCSIPRRLCHRFEFAQRESKWIHGATQSRWTSVQRVWEGYSQSDHSSHL